MTQTQPPMKVGAATLAAALQAAPAAPIFGASAPELSEAPGPTQIAGQVPKVVPLAYPVVTPDGTTVTELTLRRLKGKEMKGVDPQRSDGKFGSVLKFIAVMNALPDSVMDELDAADIMELVGEVTPFLARGTGVTPSL